MSRHQRVLRRQDRHEIPVLDRIELPDLVHAYARQGDETIGSVPHPDFALVHDGWAAALYVAHKYGAQWGRLRNVLPKRTCNPEEIVFESFAVLKRRPAANLDAEERAQHLQVAVSGYWERVVQEPHVRVRPGEIVENCLHRNPVSIRPPVPSTPPSLHRTTPPAPPPHSSPRSPRQHPRRVHGTRTNAFVAQPRRVDPDIFQTHIRRREPLPYPLAIRPDNQVPGFILDPQTGSYLPTAAVFFASRFNRLRELSRLLSHEERPAGYENPTIVHKIKVEIYSSLISMLLYYLGQPEIKGTPSSLRFNYEEWQDVYEQCDWSGSEVFGTRAGFGLNRDFFLGLLKREIFDEWTTKATEWWVPGEGHEVAELRAMMGEKWLQLKAELWMFYEDLPIAEDYPHLAHDSDFDQSSDIDPDEDSHSEPL